jgi:exodeoxyribonuclease V alpha subunit
VKPARAALVPPLADHLAGLLARLDPGAPASLLAATRLLVALELRGHTRLPLSQGCGAALAEAGLAAEPWAHELPADVAAARAAWAGCPLVATEPGADTAAPLVLQSRALALRRHWHDERRAAARLHERLQARGDAADAATLAPLLDALFPPRAGTAAAEDAQRQAAVVAARGRVAVITGGPGTGKTWTAARVLVLLQALHGTEPLRLSLAAPTGKAAARLRQSIEAALQPGGHPVPEAIARARATVAAALAAQPARTLHATLGSRPGTRRFVHGAGQPLATDLLLVDEASMVHGEMLTALLEALPATARLVLLGDRDQLASVEAGAVMAELCTAGSALAPQTVTLTAGHRFDGPIAELAAAANRGDTAAAHALLGAGHDALHMLPLPTPAPLLALATGDQGHGPFVALLRQRPADATAFEPWAVAVLRALDGFRLLAALREGPVGVMTLNARLTDALGFRPGTDGWFEGRPVMATRNEPQLDVFNGDVGVALAPPGGGALRVWFPDGPALRSVAAARLAAVETAWAMTVHKSQGSEFGHVALVMPGEDSPVLTREWVYTGLTRARRRLTLAGPQPALLAQALARRTRRFSGLGEALSAAR